MGGEAIAIGDFNSDGMHDLVTGNFPSNSLVLLGNGNGTFPPAANLLTTSGSSIAVADLNGDGRPDFMVGGFSEVFGLRFNTLSVLINNTR
jgi:hypothetical protein